MHDDIVLKCEADLQGEADQQGQVGISEETPLGMRKENDAKIMFAGLQADRGYVANAFFEQCLAELLEAASRKRRQRFGSFRKVTHRLEAAAAVGKFADIFPRAAR